MYNELRAKIGVSNLYVSYFKTNEKIPTQSYAKELGFLELFIKHPPPFLLCKIHISLNLHCKITKDMSRTPLALSVSK